MVTTLVGVMLILIALTDCFESLVLPRRITRRWRPARLYYRSSWRLWRAACGLIPVNRYRENALSIFGPLSLFGLFACWVAVLIAGFALVHWGQGTLPGELGGDLRQCLYHSGETFFTLGYGDVTPTTFRRQGGVGDRGGHRLRLHGGDHRLPAGALPSLLAAGAEHRAAWTRGPVRRRRSANCFAARTDFAIVRRSSDSWPSGKCGPQISWRATCRFPC